MHRRIPVVRRFGAMSFGLGWFEDGVWVDHATAEERGTGGGDPVVDEGGPAWEAIHAWFTCCGLESEATGLMSDEGVAAAEGSVRPIPIAATSASS